MHIPRVSSMPMGLIVADFSVHASLPSAKLCLEDTVANTKGKRKKGGGTKLEMAQRWPTSQSGGGGGAESEVAHKWAGWLHNPCRLGTPHRFRVGGRIRGGPQVGRVAT